MLSKTIFGFLTAIALLYSQNSFSQELLTSVPSTKEEFSATEKQVIATINYLENTPINDKDEKQLQQRSLLIAWISGSPQVTVSLNASTIDFNKKNSILLVIFMGGWTKYSLENNYSKDDVQCTLAGLKSAIKVYQSNKLKKDKFMDNMIELNDKGELEAWVKSKVEKK